MARISFGTYDGNYTPAWVGDYLNREHLLPGGARLDPDKFTAGADGRKFVPSGTLVGRTFEDRADGKGFGPVTITPGDSEADPPTEDTIDQDEIYLLVYDVYDAAVNPDCELYRHGGIVRENYLPGWDEMDELLQAAIRERYTTTIGAP